MKSRITAFILTAIIAVLLTITRSVAMADDNGNYTDPMIAIPAGSFVMDYGAGYRVTKDGYRYDATHVVYLSAYSIGKYQGDPGTISEVYRRRRLF